MTRNAAFPLQVRFMLTPCYIYVDSQLQVRILLTPHYIYVDSLLQVRFLLTPHDIYVNSPLQVRFITGYILSPFNKESTGILILSCGMHKKTNFFRFFLFNNRYLKIFFCQ